MPSLSYSLASVLLYSLCGYHLSSGQISAAGPDAYNLFFNIPLPQGQHSVTVGQMVVLDCEAGGSPAPTIHWMHNGRRLLQGDENREQNPLRWRIEENENEANADKTANRNRETLHLGSTRSRLFIDCISREDEGKFSCVAVSNGHEITSAMTLRTETPKNEEVPFACVMEKRNHIPVRPARVYMWTAQRLEFEGADVQLFCRADGSPPPKITWYNQHGDRIVDNRKYRVLHNGDLVIQRVNFLDNMGVYSCVAENPLGKDVVETFVYPTAP